MAGVNPVGVLVNLPVPLPSVVLLSVRTGPAAVLQQTPRAVTSVPPSFRTESNDNKKGGGGGPVSLVEGSC